VTDVRGPLGAERGHFLSQFADSPGKLSARHLLVFAHGIPPPRNASDAAEPGTVVCGSCGAVLPESESPSRMSEVRSAPEAIGAAKWAPTFPEASWVQPG
jgi:hypothetical protein